MDELAFGIFRRRLSEVLRKILVLKLFSNFKKVYLKKSATIAFRRLLSTCDWLLVTINFDDKILLFNNTYPLES